MDTQQIVAALIAERDRLDIAINALQGTVKRRGRPPKNQNPLGLSLPTPASTPNGRKRGMTAAARKAQSRRMKAYWAKRKAGKK